MQLSKIVEGTHNKISFRYENGKVSVCGRVWDKEDIKTLVEIANLLEIQGYKMKMPIGREFKKTESMFGGSFTEEVKIYPDEV